MDPIATYVFIAFKSRGLPDDTDIITYWSMIAVKSEIFRNTTGDVKIQSEKSCSYPYDVKGEFLNFLQKLDKPVCIIGHNALRYDYPLLKNNFVEDDASFPQDIMCADSMHAFYDIFEPDNFKTSKDQRMKGAFPWARSFASRQGSYSWDILYRRVMKLPVTASIPDRNMAVLEMASKHSTSFADWLEVNHYSFKEIPFLKELFVDSQLPGPFESVKTVPKEDEANLKEGNAGDPMKEENACDPMKEENGDPIKEEVLSMPTSVTALKEEMEIE